jgi:hypothetical protein
MFVNITAKALTEIQPRRIRAHQTTRGNKQLIGIKENNQTKAMNTTAPETVKVNLCCYQQG